MQVMDHWQADARGLHVQGPLVLGHLLLQDTEGMPQQASPWEELGLVITADACLHNRAEILNRLEGTEGVGPDASDERLILHTYARMGERCVEWLLGDFAFAIWDKARERLFCARDPIGIRPFFFYHHGGRFLFSSEKKGILAWPGVDAALDSDFLLRLIADAPFEADATSHRHIRVLPGGQCMVVEGGTCTRSVYWRLQVPPLLRLRHHSDYVGAYRECLEEAVRCRMRTTFPIGVELSGGLDSSAVAAIAASSIEGAERLWTFSNVAPLGADGRKAAADEAAYIDDVLRHSAIRNAVYLSSSGVQGLLDAHDLDILANSGVDRISAFWTRPMRAAMQERGVRRCLSGFFGDEVATHPGTRAHAAFLEEGDAIGFLAACMRRGDFRSAAKHLLFSVIPYRYYFDRLPARRQAGSRRSFLLEGAADGPPSPTDPHQAPSAAVPGYRAHLLRLAGNTHAGRRIQSESLYGIIHRMNIAYPFADIRLLSLVLSIPAEHLSRPSTDRYLYREAMRGVVPESVRLRRSKGIPAGVYHMVEERARAASMAAWLEQELAAPRHGILRLLDRKKVLAAYDTRSPANSWKGEFHPGFPFHLQCLVRFLSTQEEG